MNKEKLIELGVSEEIADKIIEATKGFIPKHRFDEVNEAKKAADEQVKTIEGQLAELKKSVKDNDELTRTISELQDANKAAKEKHEKELKDLQVKGAVERALLAAGAKNIKAVKALLDLTNAELDGETVKGLSDQVKKLQEGEDSKFLFNSADDGDTSFKGANPPGGGNKPPAGAGSVKNPWSKESWNLTEQGRLLKEKPELAAHFKSLAQK